MEVLSAHGNKEIERRAKELLVKAGELDYKIRTSKQFKEPYVEHYRNFKISNTWNSDGFVITTEDKELFKDKEFEHFPYCHHGNFGTLECAKKYINKYLEPLDGEKGEAVNLIVPFEKALKVIFDTYIGPKPISETIEQTGLTSKQIVEICKVWQDIKE